ncbi:disease resistance protein RPS2-like [Punica granatum]|uniref:Disease resistance protein RPS2-like n=1 Tax=Punica granatum TaxID=22663 RepID=A0A6P8DJ64_PUNGR|nr:disease resistance protein RPS2-like [Punica granatum]
MAARARQKYQKLAVSESFQEDIHFAVATMQSSPFAASDEGCMQVEMSSDANIGHAENHDTLSWELFHQNAGEVMLSMEIQTIAKEIVRACARDSRSLTLMARALRNVSDTEIWEYALDSLSLQHASCRDDYENLSVNVLKFCIELLDDDVTRNCLKSLAMQSKSKEVGRASMLDSWIGDGMLVTRSEGEIIVKNLLDAKLLELSENGELVKFVDIGQHLVHLALHPEEGSELLMQGGLGLVEPTEVEEWERTKEICLMHNNLTEFPENPRCPSLLPLFLQRNHKLRVIPSLFFRHMPALEVLNLSRTHIKSLPDSLFQLVSLQRLFLNECILLRTLSAKVGGLRNLEVLDLKGTKLMGLPKEIEQLVNLTCLEVSILSTSCKLSEEPHPLIPSRVLLSLSQLEELNIDVGPDAERWDSCMEVLVDGICSLGRIIIGKHIGCIMSRLPPDIEFKLECWDRYLKYIHGKGILQDVMKVLRKADAFFLDRHTDLKKLSDFGKENLEYLRCCVLGECNELQVLNDGEDFGEQGDRICLGSLKYLYVYYVKNLEAIWRGPVQKGSLSCLKSLTLRTCPKITSIFTRELLENLCNLEELTLEDCPALVSLVSCKRCSLRNILLPAQVEEDEASLPAAIDEHL